ncbi:MAG: metallophosphoesterase [Candidatus Omnitrophica bacterium]|nr:metallophosphoesterase [Candidatus Omnitrophota bacterium]
MAVKHSDFVARTPPFNCLKKGLAQKRKFTLMKRLLLIMVLIAALLSVNSVAPVLWLYLKKCPAQPTNEAVVEKLKTNSGEYFGFIAFGDNHAGFIFDDSAFLKMIRLMNREDRYKKLPIDFAVNLGDVTFSKGREWDYCIYDKLRSLIKWPVISLMGNHDYQKGGWRIFRQRLGKHEFAFSNRNSYFIALDNKITDLTEEQFAWLESQLKKDSSYKHIFLFMHKPPISLYQQSWYRPELSPWSYRLMKLCEQYNVKMVLAGHEHMFRERVFGGVRYVITGGAGMLIQIPEAEGGYLHYIVVRVNGDYVDYEVRKVFPPLWEYLTYYVWKEILYALKHIFLKDGLLL